MYPDLGVVLFGGNRRVENLNVKGLVRNHPPFIPPNRGDRGGSDCGWGMFVNFLSYKLEREDKKLVEIDRFFPSSHICPECLTQQPKMDLSIREWTCINKACNAHHDRDEATLRQNKTIRN
jgi:putative transposase